MEENTIEDVVETSSTIVSEIINKYNLTDINEESIEGLGEGKTFVAAGASITSCAKKIALFAMTNEEAISSLSNSLGIQKNLSEKLLEDIKTKIVPIIQKQAKVQKKQNGDKNVINKSDTLPIMSTAEIIENKKNTVSIVKTSTPSRTKIKKIPEIKETIKPSTAPNNGPDSYREPIE